MTDPVITLSGVDLNKLIERRHPDYTKTKRDHWNFCELCYRGGREWFDATPENLFQFYKEGPKEYAERKDRSHRANHTKRVIDTINQYLYRQDPVRDWDKVPDYLSKFWKNPQLGREGDINDFMRECDKWVSVFGRIYVVIDRPGPDTDMSVMTRRRGDEALPYAYIVFPQRALDFAFGNDGLLLWILFAEDHRPSGLDGSGTIETRWRLWTRDSWYLMGTTDPKNPEKVFLIDSGSHGLGMVPVVTMSADDDSKWSSSALVSDITYMDRTLANYASMLDEIIYEQTFSQLTMPAEAVAPGTTEANQLIAAAKNRIFIYNSTQPGAKPEYISPDAAQARLIIEAMDDIKKDIYAITGTSNDANSHALETGKAYSSGRVREYDHTQIENVLLNKAREAESVEEQMIVTVCKWMARGDELDPAWVIYPDRFDVRGLAAELELCAELNELDGPITLIRTQMKVVADKSFPRLNDEAKAKIHTEIDTWKPGFIIEQEQADTELDIKAFTAETQAIAMERAGANADANAAGGNGDGSQPAAKPARKVGKRPKASDPALRDLNTDTKAGDKPKPQHPAAKI